MVDYFIVVRTLHCITAYYCFSNTLCDEDKLVVSYFKTYIGVVISLIARCRGPLYERVAYIVFYPQYDCCNCIFGINVVLFEHISVRCLLFYCLYELCCFSLANKHSHSFNDQ